MIPTLPGPGDLPTPPEEPMPRRGAEPAPLVLQAFEVIEALKRDFADLRARFEALERRVAALESAKA